MTPALICELTAHNRYYVRKQQVMRVHGECDLRLRTPQLRLQVSGCSCGHVHAFVLDSAASPWQRKNELLVVLKDIITVAGPSVTSDHVDFRARTSSTSLTRIRTYLKTPSASMSTSATRDRKLGTGAGVLSGGGLRSAIRRVPLTEKIGAEPQSVKSKCKIARHAGPR